MASWAEEAERLQRPAPASSGHHLPVVCFCQAAVRPYSILQNFGGFRQIIISKFNALFFASLNSFDGLSHGGEVVVQGESIYGIGVFFGRINRFLYCISNSNRRGNALSAPR